MQELNELLMKLFDDILYDKPDREAKVVCLR